MREDESRRPKRMEKIKTIMTITIESKDSYDNVYPETEDEKAFDDYKTDEEKEELKDFREEFALGVHQSAVEAVEARLEEGDIDEVFFDNMNDKDISLEFWEERSDYDLTISIEKKSVESKIIWPALLNPYAVNTRNITQHVMPTIKQTGDSAESTEKEKARS